MRRDDDGQFWQIALFLGAFSILGMVVGGIVANDQGKSGWELFGYIAIGGAMGLAVGGVVLATMGAGAAIFLPGGLSAPVLGVTAAQAFAIGALAYNFTAMIVAPIIGIEMQPIEWAAPSYNSQISGETPIRPSRTNLSYFLRTKI